jgi:hypothetical protein
VGGIGYAGRDAGKRPEYAGWFETTTAIRPDRYYNKLRRAWPPLTEDHQRLCFKATEKIAQVLQEIDIPVSGGVILWYDFRFDNPRNRNVKGIEAAEIMRQTRKATVQALIFRWTKTANHGKLILGAAGQ